MHFHLTGWTWNIQQNFNSRMNSVQINHYSKLRVGKNILANRLGILNNLIQFDWLNFSLNSFKLKVKIFFRHKGKWSENEWQNLLSFIFILTMKFSIIKNHFYDENKSYLINFNHQSELKTLCLFVFMFHRSKIEWKWHQEFCLWSL